jgi:hypothetical protein
VGVAHAASPSPNYLQEEIIQNAGEQTRVLRIASKAQEFSLAVAR